MLRNGFEERLTSTSNSFPEESKLLQMVKSCEDRQTDRQNMDVKTDRHITDGKIYRKRDEPIKKQQIDKQDADRWTGRLAFWHSGRLADWQTGRLADWQTGRLADWQTGRLTD
jgi:hypothetical protein